MKAVFVLALLAGAALAAADADLVVTQQLVDEINGKGAGWTAKHHDRFGGMTVDQAKKFLGTNLDRRLNVPMRAAAMVDGNDIPDSFDAREQWPNCIGDIRDQGQCGSCWAFGAAEALSDRYCIQAGINVLLSPQDMVSCDSGNYGCQGGYLDVAWKYLENTGVVDDACFPYTSGSTGSEPPCPQGTCPGTGSFDKYKAKNTVQLPQDEQQIQNEVMTKGPVEVAFEVYSDFMSYSGGVYEHTSGGFLGGHAVKLIGWGVDNGKKYWLIANSWGTSWGESGLFRIARGQNECGIESQAIAGDAAPSDVSGEFITDAFVSDVNTAATTWTAAKQERFAGWTEEDFKNFLGLRMDRAVRLPVASTNLVNDLPTEFDSRDNWPGCVGDIRDQGQCGSCWAFGAAEALSDRFCIASSGSVKVTLSPQDMVSCDSSNYGCNGGYLDLAWKYLENTGVVDDDCFPYTSGSTGSEPPCPQGTCPGTGEPTKYQAKGSATLTNEGDIMNEIYTNGPVETGFTVYSDFMSYSGGIYQHQSGGQLGGHAVKIVGWGEENGTKFWTVANSWGTSWGEKGFFRILRGSDECGFESNAIRGDADLSTVPTPVFA